MPSTRPRLSVFVPHVRQQGQALVYGLFMLTGGMVALFFMFNTGQLTAEKTKLVNTADAVAYSAAVMHARALNFNAYSNRALIANEVLIAQMVSVSSWLAYSSRHAQRISPLLCTTYYSVPIVLALKEYEPLCLALAYGAGSAIQSARTAFDIPAQGAVIAAEAAKASLQLAETTMYASFLPARKALMQEVADANYLNNGSVSVDTVALTDNFSLFEGQPFITPNTGDARARFRATELAAAYTDDFVENRTWSSHSPWPCIVAPRGKADRTGATTLVGYDEWRANDSAAIKLERWRVRLKSIGCRGKGGYDLGRGKRSANTNPSSDDWYYSGVPNFFDLSTKALANPDPRLQFAIRLTRAKTEARTSAGTSAVKPGGRMAVFTGDEAKGVMAAVATSEVYFERSSARADGQEELASLFNPYWQARLIGNSGADLATAATLQEVSP